MKHYENPTVKLIVKQTEDIVTASVNDNIKSDDFIITL